MFAVRCGLDAGSCETPYGLTLRYNYGNIKSYIDYVIKGREEMRIAVCDDNAVFENTINFILNNALNNNYYISYLFYIPIMYPGTNLWYEADENDRCYEWDKYFVNNENIIEEGKIIYKNPNVDINKLKFYVDNSNRILSNTNKGQHYFRKLIGKKDKIKNIFAEGHNGIDSVLNLKWFTLSVIYTLIEKC